MKMPIIDVVIYRKDSKGGRWNPDDRANFKLEIKAKI